MIGDKIYQKPLLIGVINRKADSAEMMGRVLSL